MTTCMRVGCDQPATWLVHRVYDRSWPACDQHEPAMAKAMSIGLPSDTTATSERITRGRTSS